MCKQRLIIKNKHGDVPVVAVLGLPGEQDFGCIPLSFSRETPCRLVVVRNPIKIRKPPWTFGRLMQNVPLSTAALPLQDPRERTERSTNHRADSGLPLSAHARRRTCYSLGTLR